MKPCQQELVFWYSRDAYDSVMFARRDEFDYEIQRLNAYYRASTWGAFVDALPDMEMFRCQWLHSASRLSDDPFSPYDLPGYDEGDYPEWLRKSQVGLIPDDLVEKFGGIYTLGFHNHLVLDLPAEYAEEIAADLRVLGHLVDEVDFELAQRW